MDNALYVYAIVGHAASIPPELTGLQAAPLSLVYWRDLAAVVSQYQGVPIQPTADALLGHEAVVEALCQAGPTLPARFGAVLGSQDALIQALASKYAVLLADLERVGNKVELGLTILWKHLTEPEHAPSEHALSPALDTRVPGPGTRYLYGRVAHYQHELAQHRQARMLLAELQRALHPFTLEQRYRTVLEPRLAIRAAYLAHQKRSIDLQRAIEAQRQARPDLRWLISGPWPPYSFVSGAASPASSLVQNLIEENDTSRGAKGGRP